PEQFADHRIDGRSDQYSLACVLYEMLIGEPPFTGSNAMIVFARHTSEAIPSLRIVRPTIPEALEEAIFRAMAKVPADRFETMSAFSDAIEAAVANTEATPRTSLTRVTAARGLRYSQPSVAAQSTSRTDVVVYDPPPADVAPAPRRTLVKRR